LRLSFVAAGLEPGVEPAFESAAEIVLELGEASETSETYVQEIEVSSDLTNNFQHNDSP
jgi:hypothetical protein